MSRPWQATLLAAAALRPGDLLEAPTQFVNRTVEVEIVERLNGVGGDVHAQACVGMPESAPCVLSLVPSTFVPDAPDRHARKFRNADHASGARARRAAAGRRPHPGPGRAT